jgi:hypothetical protein
MLGNAIARELVEAVMRDLNLTPQVIDAKFLPVDDETGQTPTGGTQSQPAGVPRPFLFIPRKLNIVQGSKAEAHLPGSGAKK